VLLTWRWLHQNGMADELAAGDKLERASAKLFEISGIPPCFVVLTLGWRTNWKVNLS
jgi:hypothetical protein